MSRRLNISQSTYNRIEKGNVSIYRYQSEIESEFKVELEKTGYFGPNLRLEKDLSVILNRITKEGETLIREKEAISDYLKKLICYYQDVLSVIEFQREK